MASWFFYPFKSTSWQSLHVYLVAVAHVQRVCKIYKRAAPTHSICQYVLLSCGSQWSRTVEKALHELGYFQRFLSGRETTIYILSAIFTAQNHNYFGRNISGAHLSDRWIFRAKLNKRVDDEAFCSAINCEVCTTMHGLCTVPLQIQWLCKCQVECGVPWVEMSWLTWNLHKCHIFFLVCTFSVFMYLLP